MKTLILGTSGSWKLGGRKRKQMGYKIVDLTQQPEQAS